MYFPVRNNMTEEGFGCTTNERFDVSKDCPC